MTDPEGMERMSGQRDRAPSVLLCPAGFPVPPGTKEWVVQKGDPGAKGDKGDRGERGQQGLPSAMRRAIVYLFVVALAMSGANLLWTSHEVNVGHAAQVRDQAVQRKEGEVIERKLCTSFGSIAALKPPPGNPLTNPSRAYDQNLHSRLDGLGSDLGCR